jgi:hypothetical protein
MVWSTEPLTLNYKRKSQETRFLIPFIKNNAQKLKIMVKVSLIDFIIL